LAALGFDKVTYFHNGLIDGWAFIAEGKDLIAIAFRGTKSATNWQTNFQVEMVHPTDTDDKLRVHKGFYQAFEQLNDGDKGLKTAVAVIEAENPATPIYLTGHSLGGALAQIATAVFGSDQIAACYTLGRRASATPISIYG
jgi:triacylglycerol lipase